MITRLRYHRKKEKTEEDAIITIQKIFKGLKQRKLFLKKRNAIQKVQATVLAIQFKNAYQKTREHVVKCQMYIKRNLAMRKFYEERNKRQKLEENLTQINSLIKMHNIEASTFKEDSDSRRTFEDYELNEVRRRDGEQLYDTNVHEELRKLLEENKRLHQQLQTRENSDYSEETKVGRLKEIEKNLGPNAYQLDGMLKGLNEDAKRVADNIKNSQKLPIKIQHPYQYSKWDSINDPYNVVDNVLKDDETIYKALTPDIDLTLNHGRKCFVSEILIHAGDGGPASVEVHVSQFPNTWDFVEAYECSDDEIQRLTLPGENNVKYLRIRSLKSNQGGKIVKIRHIEVNGVTKE